MNDKELLENAANAAGLEIKTKFYEIGGWHAWWRHVISEGNEEWIDWNPLKDDGDALRLAVKLWLSVEFFEHDFERVIVSYPENLGAANELWHEVNEPTYAKDRNSATRRAIVRAAAEIGKSK